MAPIHEAAPAPSTPATPLPVDDATRERARASTSLHPCELLRPQRALACTYLGYSSFLILPTGCLMHPIQMTLQSVDVDRPEAAKWREPGVDLHEGLRSD